MDTLSRERRSANMSRIRAKDTRPELVVRSLAHKAGYRFRLHAEELPGRPDLVFPGRRKVIFVHGCFWHQHGRCVDGRRRPLSNRSYWNEKLAANSRRDRANRRMLRRLGWNVLVIWECETRNPDRVVRKVTLFLGHDHS